MAIPTRCTFMLGFAYLYIHWRVLRKQINGFRNEPNQQKLQDRNECVGIGSLTDAFSGICFNSCQPGAGCRYSACLSLLATLNRCILNIKPPLPWLIFEPLNQDLIFVSFYMFPFILSNKKMHQLKCSQFPEHGA